MRALLCLAVLSAVALSTEAGYKMRKDRLPESIRYKPEFRRPVVEDDSRIVGGENVDPPHSIPYQISMQNKATRFHRCGGSVYDSNYVITAAHCCVGESASSIGILAGAFNKANDEPEQQRVGVLQVKVHESYSSGTFENDICLLQLDTPLDLNENVQGVHLPPQRSETPTTETIIVSGWGTTSSGGSSPDELKCVELPIVSDEECDTNYGPGAVLDSMICAGDFQNGGIDSCQGDSGGPLTRRIPGSAENDMRELVGIVSWGRGCALAGYPGVNTQVSYFTDWVIENTK